jgi:two-component system, NtrC family, sensor kinase
MAWYSNYSIRRKLILIIMMVSGVALLLISGTLVAYEIMTFRQAMIQQSTTLANIIGYNCAASIIFHEADDAEVTLASLASEPKVESACIYIEDGTILSKYWKDTSILFVPPPVETANARFEDDHLILFHQVKFKDEFIGTVYIKSNLTELNARMERYVYIVVGILALVAMITFVLSSKLQRVISEPIRSLLSTANTVASKQDYKLRAERQSDDELGMLVDGFNNMLTQIQRQDKALRQEINERTRAEKELEEVHRQLLDVSREMGMAEVATGVLHNVGNVLNSVNVSSHLITEGLENIHVSADYLSKAANLINDHSQDLGGFMSTDPKGKMLPAYFTGLADQLREENEDIRREVELLIKNIAHIHDIVSTQQNFATTSGLIEYVQVQDVVEYALELSHNSLERHGIEVVKDFKETFAIEVDKHKIIQIIVNLFRNAKDAMAGEDLLERRLTVRIDSINQKKIAIVIMDTGVGISAEDLTRIFSHGFTTKQNGHGFGLHSAVLAAKQLNAVLSADSEGTGKGAAFTLTLPV